MYIKNKITRRDLLRWYTRNTEFNWWNSPYRTFVWSIWDTHQSWYESVYSQIRIAAIFSFYNWLINELNKWTNKYGRAAWKLQHQSYFSLSLILFLFHYHTSLDKSIFWQKAIVLIPMHFLLYTSLNLISSIVCKKFTP